MARSLVDTNILVYAHDRKEAIKRPRAVELIDRLSAGGEFVLSAQCLNEFSSVVLRRGMPIADVRAAVSTWSGLAEVLPLTQAATSAGLAAVERHGLSFWDALIWAAAREAKVGVVLSEDFQHGREIEGVVFVNPFREA